MIDRDGSNMSSEPEFSKADKAKALVEASTQLVSVYLANNPLPASELPTLVEQVYGTLNGLVVQTIGGGKNYKRESQKPAVPIEKSLEPDYLICLECGGKYKSMKKHLAASYGMSPEEYRAKWKLAADYPMTAPSYSSRRSNLAKNRGLGRKP